MLFFKIRWVANFDNLTLEHLHAILANCVPKHAIAKARLTVIRAYVAEQHAEQSLLNSRLAAAELNIERLEQQLTLR